MKIVIIDDDPIVAGALKTIIETKDQIQVCALGNDGQELISLYSKHLPDIVLLDIQMKHMSGIDAGKDLLSKYEDARIIFLTTFSDDHYIIEALRMGAKGYLLKQNYPHIIPALEAVIAGQHVFGEEIVSKLPRLSDPNAKKESVSEKLTEKEKETLALIGEGLSNKEIAEKLFVSEGTVRNTVSMLLDKLNLKSRTQLAIYYLKHTDY